jgi:NAD+ kinase
MTATVALVHQPYRPETAASAREVGAWLESRGAAWELLSAFELDRYDPTAFTLALSFGGDGTTLRTARWSVGGAHGRAGGAGRPAALPIVPVGMGTLSFLAELAPTDVEERLEPYLAGDFWRDERAMLCVDVDGQRALALNEVVIARGAALRAVSIDLAVHGHDVTCFTADGVVVATATGSTAYALAAGGPVMAPELRNVVIVPIAGHLSALGSLVLPETAEIRLMAVRSQPAVLSADGQVDFDLPVNRPVMVHVAEERTVFARRGDPADFYAHLTARLRRR